LNDVLKAIFPKYSSKKNLMEAEKAIYVRVCLGIELQVVHSKLNTTLYIDQK
jgi:hypothetical protein